MTIDEAIKHCEEVAENQEWLSESYGDDSMGTKLCKECAEEHRAEMLGVGVQSFYYSNRGRGE